MSLGRHLAALLLAAIAGVALAVMPAAAQGLSPFLPSAQRSRAAGLLSIIDEAQAGIEKRRDAALQALSGAERASLAAYAAAMAAGGSLRWAGPGGAPAAGTAGQSFLAARSQAASALRELASDGGESDGLPAPSPQSSRDSAADKLVALVGASRLEAKAMAGIASYLEGRAPRLAGLFPEALAIGSALKKSGPAGLDLWIAALAPRGCDAIARKLLSLRGDALRIVPASGGDYASLAESEAAYRALCESLPWTAQSAGILDPAAEGASAFGKAVEACLALPEKRSLDLVRALSRGDGRERAAADALLRLARILGILPPERARHLAAAAGLAAAKLLELAARYDPGTGVEASAARPPIAVGAKLGLAPSRGEARALDELWACFSERLEKERALDPAAFAEGRPLPLAGFPDPLLGLLENPTLMEIARVESRYARLYADAGGRLGRLYDAADAAACADLAADPGVAAAAARAVGGAAASISLRAAELPAGDPSVSRNVSFVARARGQSGAEADFPVDAAAAFPAYAAAFEKVFGLRPAAARASAAAGPPKPAPLPASAERAGAVLRRYRQRVLEACLLPDGSAIVLASLPEGGSFGAAELEAALISGDLP